MAMRISDQMYVSCAQIFAELSQANGATAEERVSAILEKYGWDRELARIEDDTFRAVISEMLRAKALRSPPRVNESNKPASDVELERWRAETDRLANSGLCGDLLSDKLDGLKTPDLAKKLPRETYFVASLGKHIPREELPSQLIALHEIRKRTREDYLAREAAQDLLRAEMFILDELIRRANEASRAPASADTAPAQ